MTLSSNLCYALFLASILFPTVIESAESLPTLPGLPTPSGTVRCLYPNEEYTNCGSSCPDICGEPKPDICPYNCVTGCFCKPGFIRIKGGGCIPEILCTLKPPAVCRDVNEEYADCGTACPDICDQPPPEVCTRQCVPGCFCKPGYIRSTKGGPCIPKHVCPPRPSCPPTQPGKCGINEVYTDGTACPPICDEPPPDVCIAVVVTGCFCKTGFIRRTRGGECIPEILCRNRPGRCPANEEYLQCGTNCPPTCQKPNPGICSHLCVKGCFCKSGFIRKAKGGPCIRKHSCSHNHVTCHHNEEYTTCGSTCPAFCNPHQGPVYPYCAAFCVKGCFCKEGFIRLKGGPCIPLSLCGPKKGDFCPPTSNQICIRASNKCCSSADCPNQQLCCSENCGNTCKDPVKHKTSGTIVNANENCKIDAV